MLHDCSFYPPFSFTWISSCLFMHRALRKLKRSKCNLWIVEYAQEVSLDAWAFYPYYLFKHNVFSLPVVRLPPENHSVFLWRCWKFFGFGPFTFNPFSIEMCASRNTVAFLHCLLKFFWLNSIAICPWFMCFCYAKK